jgi:hypothetical protein
VDQINKWLEVAVSAFTQYHVLPIPTSKTVPPASGRKARSSHRQDGCEGVEYDAGIRQFAFGAGMATRESYQNKERGAASRASLD